MKHLVLPVLLGVLGCTPLGTQKISQTLSFGPPDIREGLLISNLVRESATSRLEPYTVRSYGKKGVCRPSKGREIALAAISPLSSDIEVVKIGICFKQPQKLDVLTKGYTVEWLEGRGITRFSFRVTNPEGERLLLLAGKHWIHETQSEEIYFPYSDDLLIDDLVERGARFLMQAIRSAQRELCDLGVKSKTYPDKLLCQVFPDEIVFNIALIEQIDDEEFFGNCPKPDDMHPENYLHNDCAEYSIYKALIHYAQNEDKAFTYVASRAGASGPMQFMPRTYSLTREWYPDANLIPSYRKGTSDLQNSIKAAICLLDRYLDYMQPGAKKQFKLDPRTTGIYPIVAYNGGPGKARCLYARNCYVRNRESRGYQAKYKAAWDVIDLFFDYTTRLTFWQGVQQKFNS